MAKLCRLLLVVFTLFAAALCNAQTYTLTVYSQNPDSGVNVTASPTDVNGLTGGPTALTLTYTSGTSVTLQAPSTQNGTPFAYWALDSTPHVFATSLTVQMAAAHTATAVYAQPFTITPQATQNGVITPSTVQTEPSTGSVTFTESPSNTYVLQSWQVDGDTLFPNTNTTLSDGTTVNVGATTLAFANILGNHTVGATFLPTYTITPQNTQNGSLSPNAPQTITKGASSTITETPSAGYLLQTWQVDGNNVPATTTLSDGTTVTISGTTLVFGNVSGSHTVGATFIQSFTITPQATQNGTITPNTVQTIASGGSVTITETPNTGYALQSWQVDGVNVPATTALSDGTTVTISGTTLVFGNIKGNHTVGASFNLTYTITPQATQNGTLTPNTVQTVTPGSSLTITETPSTGYALQTWQVDGTNVPATTTLTDGTTVTITGTTLVFGNIKGSHTVGATFVQTFTITPQATQNGTLTPNTAQSVAAGGTVTITEAPSAGYVLQFWQVDGVNVPATTTLSDGTTVTISGTTLVFGNIKGNHTVGATFNLTFTITPQAAQNGTITPNTAQSVAAGGTVTITEAPSAGYVFQTWQVDGTSVPATTTLSDGTTVTIAGTTLVFGNIKGSHTVGATFAPQTLTITPQPTQNGTLSPNTAQTVTLGGAVTFTGTPSTGYGLQTWQVDGANVPATTTLSDGTTVTISSSTLTFGNVKGNHTVGATFGQTFTITPQTTQNGTITPNTAQTAIQGGSITLTETPTAGYTLLTWLIDGIDISASTTLSDGTTVTISGSTLTLANLKGSHTVGATFSLQTGVITPQTTQNGALSPNTVQTVTLGGTITITDTPSTGYVLQTWIVDGNTVTGATTLSDGTTVTISTTTLVFGNIKGSHTVGATFTQIVPQPADKLGVDSISIDSLTAYGSAWRKGTSWPVGPSPIPQNFVTNAAAIWRSGESYTYNPALPQPSCWTPLNTNQGNVVKAALGAAVASVGKSTTANSFAVTINVQTPVGTKAYSVEELIPAGAAISQISDGGVFDPIARAIRWGPFLDNKPRNLTYTASNVNSRTGKLSGTASFNGSSITISGARKLALTGGHH